MSTTTEVEVAFVNEPKEKNGKKGSIKTKDGQYYGVWADKLKDFKVGGTYEVEYDESQWQGKTYRNIKTSKLILDPGTFVEDIKGTRQIVGVGNGAGYKYSTSPTDAERMFVCSLANAYISAGKLMLNPGEIKHAVEMLRSVWNETFGRDE